MKKNVPLIIAIALPFVFVGILSLAVLIPRAEINPQHDFIFTTEITADPYYGSPYNFIFEHQYQVQNGKIVATPLPQVTFNKTETTQPLQTKFAPTLYYYDIDMQTVKELSFEDAQSLNVEAGPSSPDGYSVYYEYGSGNIFDVFGVSSSEYGYVIGTGEASKKLNNLNPANRYGYDQFTLIAWVK